MNIEIKINNKNGDKELYLFGEFQASWDSKVDNMETIIPYALDCAVEIGKKEKEMEILKVLGVK